MTCTRGPSLVDDDDVEIAELTELVLDFGGHVRAEEPTQEAVVVGGEHDEACPAIARRGVIFSETLPAAQT